MYSNFKGALVWRSNFRISPLLVDYKVKKKKKKKESDTLYLDITSKIIGKFINK